jgi:PIN domain nuclease of toxin-antitoxin system
MIILATALPIRPNPLIPTFVAILHFSLLRFLPLRHQDPKDLRLLIANCRLKNENPKSQADNQICAFVPSWLIRKNAIFSNLSPPSRTGMG